MYQNQTIMKHIVKLRFFCDDANGEYGLAHERTYSDNTPFNAFWSGTGMFHDVFEHWFEYEHKYFRGDAAMNVGGEMVAVGAMFYFIDEMGLSNRRPNSFFYSDAEAMRRVTESEILEAVCSGYTNFGDTLVCDVPKQKPSENSELDYQCEKMFENIQKSELPSETESQEFELAKAYKTSVTLAKIKTLHRYGYNLAKRMFPNTWENRNTLNEFIEYWSEFTNNNEAEKLSDTFKGIDIIVTKRNGLLSWKAVLVPMYGIDTNPVTLKPNFCPKNIMEDIDIENLVFED